jgi:sugar (pentulose or hexulose) kinase
MTPKLISLDIGTTHTKAGLFTKDGSLLKTASRQTVVHQHPIGGVDYDPGEVWAAVIELIQELSREIDTGDIAAVGIAGMAETGLLVDNKSGQPRTPLIPWFDSSASPQAKLLKSIGDPQRRFLSFGIHPNFKCSLAKLLWLQGQDPHLLEGSVWLNTADYIAYRFCGVMATDYSLAGRSYAFQIASKAWDVEWLQSFGMHPDLLPPAVPSGQPVGEISAKAATLTGLLPGTPVAICGHDHVCAAFAGIGLDPSKVFDSMGTAEALVGCLDHKELGEKEYQSGLVFGCHVAGGGYYWMGGMSASGGSIEWLRSVLGDPPLSYPQLASILSETSPGPSGIFYFPYLSGSGSPHTDIQARGAFVGLNIDHTRPDLVKAVLEGTAYEAEFIRQAAQDILGKEITSFTASGGGTRFPGWMQIKADISGCTIEVPTIPEAVLLGAALIAGLGIGLYADAGKAISAIQKITTEVYLPDHARHHAYQSLYQSGFLLLQAPLRQVSRNINPP